MNSGNSGSTRVRWFCSLWIICFLGTSAVAQQPRQASPAQNIQSTEPSPPTAQLIPQTSTAPGQANGDSKSDDSTKNDSDQSTLVKLGPGDLIEISVYNVPELNSKVRVSNSGDVYLPLIDYVHIEGLTQEEAQALIEKRLSDGGFVRNPHVTIFVDEPASQGVTIIGEVVKTGIFPMVADHKLYEMLSQAGGFTQSASHRIAILRKGHSEPIHINLPRNLADDVSANIEVMPGDTITVPKAPIIYVVGDVGRPSGLLVDNGTMTVLQALALAGGTNKTAKLGGARLIRKGPNGMTETKIQIKKMLEAKAPDMTLQADDILFVPVSGGRVLAGRTFEAAMAAATAVSVYTIHP